MRRKPWSKDAKICLLLFLFALLFCSVWGVLAYAQDLYRPVSDQELMRFENYIQKLEMEKQTWLSLVQKSQMESNELKNEVKELKTYSQSLSIQLLDQRKKTESWENSFYEYVDGVQLKLQEKDRVITEQSQEISSLKVLLAKAKGTKWIFIIIAAGLALVIIGYIAVKVCRFLKIIPV